MNSNETPKDSYYCPKCKNYFYHMGTGIVFTECPDCDAKFGTNRKWSKTPPIEAGWYWYREERKVQVVEVYEHSAYPKLRARWFGRNSMVNNLFGEWGERIQKPE